MRFIPYFKQSSLYFHFAFNMKLQIKFLNGMAFRNGKVHFQTRGYPMYCTYICQKL